MDIDGARGFGNPSELLSPPDPRVLAAVDRLCAELLAPTAAESDRMGVPRSHLASLAQIGATTALVAASTSTVHRAFGREIVERVSAACGTTWFCLTQHAHPAATVLTSENDAARQRWGTSLYDGSALAGIAFAHVRRPGTPKISVAEAGGDWVVNGHLDWVTSWPICDVVLVVVAERDDPERLVLALVEPPSPDPAAAPGLAAGPRLPLAAMGGTHTWPVDFQDYRLPAEAVVARMTRAEFLDRDRLTVVNANPAVFGLARAAATFLLTVGEERGQAEAVTVAVSLLAELDEVRDEAYALADRASADPDFAVVSLAERAQLRARAHSLALRSAQGVVLAGAGSAMLLAAPGQRWVREAMFHLVQAQTPLVRDAGLALLTRGAGADNPEEIDGMGG